LGVLKKSSRKNVEIIEISPSGSDREKIEGEEAGQAYLACHVVHSSSVRYQFGLQVSASGDI